MRIVSGSSAESLYFVAFSTADHVARVTGLTSFQVFFSAAGTTGTTQSVTVSEINSTQMPGVYRVLMTDSSITSLGAGIDSRELCLHITSSMDPVTRTVELYRRTATTGQTLALNTSGKIADVESILSKVTSIDTDIDTALSRLSSIETNTTLLVTRLTSVETDVDSVLSKVTSIETNTTGIVTKVSSIDTKVTAIQAQTTQMAFTVAGKVDAGIYYINGVQVQGTGTTTDVWRPV
ncbi:MAG: hypothetical protein ACREUA_07370 [Burkholderiales bacterium]